MRSVQAEEPEPLELHPNVPPMKVLLPFYFFISNLHCINKLILFNKFFPRWRVLCRAHNTQLFIIVIQFVPSLCKLAHFPTEFVKITVPAVFEPIGLTLELAELTA